MTTVNRFAPPKALVVDVASEAEMWREGKVLVMHKSAAFPHRCIKCNAPAAGPMRRYKLQWHTPWLYLLILAAMLLYLVVALAVRKRVTVDVGLCERHQRYWLIGRIVGWGGFALMMALALAGAATSEFGYVAAALLLALPWMIATLVMNRILIPRRIDDQYLRATGAGKGFLASLPERG